MSENPTVIGPDEIQDILSRQMSQLHHFQSMSQGLLSTILAGITVALTLVSLLFDLSDIQDAEFMATIGNLSSIWSRMLLLGFFFGLLFLICALAWFTLISVTRLWESLAVEFAQRWRAESSEIVVIESEIINNTQVYQLCINRNERRIAESKEYFCEALFRIFIAVVSLFLLVFAGSSLVDPRFWVVFLSSLLPVIGVIIGIVGYFRVSPNDVSGETRASDRLILQNLDGDFSPTKVDTGIVICTGVSFLLSLIGCIGVLVISLN